MVLSVACIMRSRKLPGSTPRRGVALDCPLPSLAAPLAVACLASLTCSLVERQIAHVQRSRVCIGMLRQPMRCRTWPAMKLRWRAMSWKVVFMTTMRAFRSLFSRASGNTAAKGRSRGASAGKQNSKGM